MNTNQNVLDIIVKNIKESGLTEKACLLACGINTSFLTDWKNGKAKSPSFDKVVKIAEYLNIDLNYLFLGKEKSLGSGLNEKEQELLAAFNMLLPADQQKFIGKMEQKYEDYTPEQKQKVSG